MASSTRRADALTHARPMDGRLSAVRRNVAHRGGNPAPGAAETLPPNFTRTCELCTDIVAAGGNAHVMVRFRWCRPFFCREVGLCQDAR